VVERLKNQLQELQRDLTLRRCLTRSTTVEDLQLHVDKVEEQLINHKTRVEQKQPVLEKVIRRVSISFVVFLLGHLRVYGMVQHLCVVCHALTFS